LEIGNTAPGFELKDNNDNEHSLADYKGRRVLLSFHPLAWTGVCTKQMQSLQANKEKFDELNTVPLGVSVDSAPCKKAWAEAIEVLDIPLLADFWPHGKLAIDYGIFLEKKGISERVNIIIDEEGKIIFFKIYPISELPDIEEVLDFLRN